MREDLKPLNEGSCLFLPYRLDALDHLAHHQLLRVFHFLSGLAALNSLLMKLDLLGASREEQLYGFQQATLSELIVHESILASLGLLGERLS